MVDVRSELERLVRERGEDYASLSRLIGRNAAYVQQFIKRGTPRMLAEEDRRILARYFGISERMLGAADSASDDGRVTVAQLDIGASAGPGALPGDERPRSHIAFDGRWLRDLGPRDPALVSIIRVDGDSMAPTLADGDEILVDRGDGATRVRDGIYVLRRDDALMVKRLAVNPAARTLSIRSDNPAYPGWPDCGADEVEIVGRVVWAGRRLA